VGPLDPPFLQTTHKMQAVGRSGILAETGGLTVYSSSKRERGRERAGPWWLISSKIRCVRALPCMPLLHASLACLSCLCLSLTASRDIPTAIGLREFLFKQHVPDIPTPLCSCGNGKETVLHLVVECEHTREKSSELTVHVGNELDLHRVLSDKTEANRLLGWILGLGRLRARRRARRGTQR